jgi:hypothetical protein
MRTLAILVCVRKRSREVALIFVQSLTHKLTGGVTGNDILFIHSLKYPPLLYVP